MTKKVFAPCVIALLSATCLTTIASAQTSWWRTYGGTSDDGGCEVRQTSDSGYIVAGYTTVPGSSGPDLYLIKTDASGQTQWTRTHHEKVYHYGASVQQTSDSGYIIAGYEGYAAVYLVKTDASGDTLWTRTYGGAQSDYGQSVQQTLDSGYMIAGYTESFGAGRYDAYLVKTNAFGDTLWTRTYGGEYVDEGRAAQQTSDGGYIIAGFTYSFGAGTPDSANVYLIKTNASGDTLWTRAYGGTNDDWGKSVQQTSDGGYIIAGWTTSFGAGGYDVYLIKTNASGDTLWTRTYGGTSNDVGNSVQQTSDGGYIIAGSTMSFGAGDEDVYLIKTNALGDTLWTRTYGGTGGDEGGSVRQASDGGYIVTGRTWSFGAGNWDVYLIKTDPDGYVGIEEPLSRRPANPTRLLVEPNPFTSVARVVGHETDVFALSDVTGRQVAICRGDRIGVGLRPGVYFMSPMQGDLSRHRGQATTIIKAAY
ncbi:MAG TPA: hypothetical protein VMH22_12940 [bacterium]|nr:hypothetical protein [bacterium]